MEPLISSDYKSIPPIQLHRFDSPKSGYSEVQEVRRAGGRWKGVFSSYRVGFTKQNTEEEGNEQCASSCSEGDDNRDEEDDDVVIVHHAVTSQNSSTGNAKVMLYKTVLNNVCYMGHLCVQRLCGNAHVEPSNSIILGTGYHPPQNDNDKLRTHLFHSIDSSHSTHPNSGIIVLGDFNHFIPGNLCSSFKLKKLVSLPTRGNKILDQVFSSLSKYYNDALILPPVGLSDYACVLLQPSNIQPATLPTTRVKKRICKAANKRALFSSLKSTNWNLLYSTNTCEDQFNLYHVPSHRNYQSMFACTFHKASSH